MTSVRWALLWPPEVPPPDGVATLDRWGFMGMAGVFRRAKALVLGGGELFQARTSFVSLLYYVGLIFWARIWGCEVWTFGLGVDPSLSPIGRWLVRRALAKARGLWVRDSQTMAILQDHHRAVKINFAPDPVWAWKIRSQPYPGSSELRRVLWILRPLQLREDIGGRLSTLLNELSSRCSLEHGFLSLHHAFDLPQLSGWRSGFRFFHRFEPWARAEDLPEIFQRYDAVVTMRFHGLVLANLSDRPAVALAAHAKVAQLAAETGWPVLSLDEADAVSLERAIRKAWDLRSAATTHSAQERGDAVRRALAELNAALPVR